MMHEGLTSRYEMSFDDATQTLKAALENGANVWNGVGGTFFSVINNTNSH